jgi:hypothetical protein
MDQLIPFANEVIVFFLMLMGMFIGDSLAVSIFGHVRGSLRQFLYILLFVILIVLGNYIPYLLGIHPLGLLNAILLFTFWGFLSVFVSRLLIFSIDLSTKTVKKLRTKKKPQTIVDVAKLIGYLQHKGMDSERIGFILSVSLGSGKRAEQVQRKAGKGKSGKKIPMDPYKLSMAFHEIGFNASEILYVLVKFFRITPEKAVRIWSRST